MTTHRLDGFNTVCPCGNDIRQIFRCGSEDFCSEPCVHKYARTFAAGHHPVHGAFYDARTGTVSHTRFMGP